MINARSESVDSKSAFRDAFQRRRCLIAASAFFEWQKEGKTRQPHLIHRRDSGPMAFAGVWEVWRESDEAEPLETCAILTTDANAIVRPLHDRMPVILTSAEQGLWLDPDAAPTELRCLLAPSAPQELEAFPVSTRVNKPDNDDPDIVRPLETSLAATGARQMTLWG
jgi:putative SOS response-associated peptidase YedK